MRIAIIGNYGAKNLGDEMILEGLLKTLRQLTPEAETLVLSGDPAETAKRYSVKSVPKFPAGLRSFLSGFSTNATLEEVKTCDYVIVGGGGLFAGVTLKGSLIWAVQVYRCLRLKKPVIMYGQSLGPVKGFLLKMLIKYLFSRAAFVAVRDRQSKSELENLNLDKEVLLMPDLALKLEKPRQKEPENQIYVCLRQLNSLTDDFKFGVAKFLDWLTIDQKFKISFIDFQKKQDDDGLVHEQIKKLLPSTTFETIPQPQSSAELFEIYSKATLILGMRLHSIIAAIRTETPFIAISYSPKVSNLLESYNLGDCCLDLTSSDFESLKRLFEKIIRNKPQIKASLEQLNQSLPTDFANVEVKLKLILSKAA